MHRLMRDETLLLPGFTAKENSHVHKIMNATHESQVYLQTRSLIEEVTSQMLARVEYTISVR